MRLDDDGEGKGGRDTFKPKRELNENKGGAWRSCGDSPARVKNRVTRDV